MQANETQANAIQDQIPHNHCWGCGPLNPDGLQIKSYAEGAETVCRFTPWPAHMAGPTHVLNGGIIATIIDCHSVCTAIAHAYQSEGRAIGSAPEIWCATASLHVEYLRPAPIDRPLTLRARVLAAEGRRTTVACTLWADETECARAELVAVRVRDSWRHGAQPAAS